MDRFMFSCVCVHTYLKPFQLLLQLSAILLITLSQLPLFLSLCCMLLSLRLHLMMDTCINSSDWMRAY